MARESRIYNNFKEEDFDTLQSGDVIKYGDNGTTRYLVVNEFNKDARVFSGDVAKTMNSDVVTLEKITGEKLDKF